MKKLIFSLFVTTLISINVVSQVEKRSVFCYTTSCCSFSIFSVEIISLKHCFTVSKALNGGNYSIKFESKSTPKQIIVSEDMILAGNINEQEEVLAIAKGTYEVVNNEFYFTPIAVLNSKKHCIHEHVTGHILGNDVDYTISTCIYWFWKGSNLGNGGIKITPELSEIDRNNLIKNQNVITFSKDLQIKTSDFIYNLKAGNYEVSDDGSIYLENVSLK